MSFFSSLVLLVALVCAVCVPIFIGHGLSVHSTAWILIGVGFGAASAVVAWAGIRLMDRGEAA